jgi:hypothetical protein
VMRTLALATHSSRLLGKKSKLRLPREFPNLLGKLPPLAGYVVVRVFRYGVPRLSRQPLEVEQEQPYGRQALRAVITIPRARRASEKQSRRSTS